MTTGPSFEPYEIRALLFFVAERRWRATMAKHAPRMPATERYIYDAEMALCDSLTAKLEAWNPQAPNPS